MKRFSTGLLVGLLTGLLLATTTFALANSPIKLIVNGNEIQSDVPPQIINGRTMVPARFLAEALGAKVEWDGANNAVVVTSNYVVGGTPTDLDAVTPTAPKITNEDNPEPGYYSMVIIMNTLREKYPNMQSMGIAPAIDTLFFGDTEYKLNGIWKNNRKYYEITPLIEAGIISQTDFK